MSTELMAPTGDGIQGTSELIMGAAAVNFDDDGDYYHAGGTEVFWDTSETQTLVGALLFTDERGIDWCQHHLIPEDAEPLSGATLGLIRDEFRVGRMHDAQVQFRASLPPGKEPRWSEALTLEKELRFEFDNIRTRVKEAIAAELKARSNSDLEDE